MAADAGTTSEVASAATPSLTGRRSMLSLRQSFGASAIPTTPKRTSLAPTTPAPAMPTPSNVARHSSASASTSSSGVRKIKQLEIGDEVIMTGTSLIGVIRHLGPVAFKAGEYAGLELIGSSAGKGKNDGSVQGVQYFACEPGNGLFCPAQKVTPLSSETPTEATARPQSAMSARSGRSSVAESRSATPDYHRKQSGIPTGSQRPPSATPGRASSRTSMGRPGSSLAGRQSTGNGTVLGSRLLPRKSIADGLADEEGRRRAKSSAEAAEAAEGRITVGSRAHRFLHMNAKELEANGRSAAAPDVFGSGAKGGSSIKGGRPSSPLKESLLASNRLAGEQGTPKGRMSFGTSGMPTPRTAKAKISLFSGKGAAGNASMLPPSAPSALTPGPERKSALLDPSSAAERTPSRASQSASSQGGEGDGREGINEEKHRMLLEELDLTPKRNSKTLPSGERPKMPDPQRSPATSTLDLEAFAITTNDVDEASRAAVPISLYEESTLEVARLKAQLASMNKQLQQANTDVEKARVQTQQESQREWEEERKVQNEDEARRRRDLENKLTAAKEQTDRLAKDHKKVSEDMKRIESESEKKIKDMQAQLQENEKLVEQLKASMDGDGAKSEEVERRLRSRDLEIAQLNERVIRMNEEKEKERQEHLTELDDLKAAGEEAFDIFQKEQALSQEMIQDMENKMIHLEAKAQEAIAEISRERDEALRGVKPTTAAEIDYQSVQEQLDQAQKRVVSLEDQLSESNTVLQQEREAHIRRKDRSVELESKLKAEVTKLKAETKRAASREADSSARVEELMEALDESRRALENERAELEILRTEALVIGGEGEPDQAKVRLEGEIERLNGLLEGARSGKRKLTRQVEEQRKEVENLHVLVDELRTHLKTVESEGRFAKQQTSNGDQSSHDTLDLRRTIESKTKELEALQRTNQPLPEQVSKLIDTHSSELQEKNEEISALKKSLDKAKKRLSRESLTVPSSHGGNADPSSPRNGESNTDSFPSPISNKRLSNNSSHSRRSRTSLGPGNGGSETLMKELAGLRSIVNTLNQELTESKVNGMQQEREMKAEADKWKQEARKWQLTVDSIKAGKEQQPQASSSDHIESRLEVERKLQQAQEQVQRYRNRLEAVEFKKREEVDKLNQDIAELEALCEATVWRREEQDARRQELERQVAKLQRNLDRALNGTKSEEQRSSVSVSDKREVELVCDDCGEKGHTMGNDCPYSKDELLF